jgi:hypothetical protein
MFTDKKRAEVYNLIRRRDQAIFEHILTPELFFQAARLSELPLVLCPLNLINLVWLAVGALCYHGIRRLRGVEALGHALGHEAAHLIQDRDQLSFLAHLSFLPREFSPR